MLLAERNYDMQDAELFVIVKGFKTWHHYIKGTAYTIFVFFNHNNRKKFMKTTHLSNRQIWWAQDL